MLTQIAPAPTPSTAADLRAQLAALHDPATVDAVLASVAAWLDASTAAGVGRVRRHGFDYARGWEFGRTRIAEQLAEAVPAVPAVRIPQQRTAA